MKCLAIDKIWSKVGKLFLRTNVNKKIMQRVNNLAPKVKEMHNQIWPDEPINLMLSKQAREARSEQPEQTIWFFEATMPVSMFFAFTAVCMHDKYRNRVDRAHACGIFESLLQKLTVINEGFTVPTHSRVGSRILGPLTVAANGSMNGAAFWSPVFYYQNVANVWANDAADETKPWITRGSNGLDPATPLSQILAFCLDPQHSSGLRQELVGPALRCLSFIALLFNTLVQKFTVIADLRKGSATKRTPFLSWGIKQQIAKRVWDGKVSQMCMSPNNIYLLFSVFFDV